MFFLLFKILFILPLVFIYGLTILIILPALEERGFLPFIISSFGVIDVFFGGNNIFLVNLFNFLCLTLVVYDIASGILKIGKESILIFLLFIYQFCVDYFSGNVTSLTDWPLYLRSIFWLLVFVMYIRKSIIVKWIISGLLISAVVLLFSNLIFGSYLDNSTIKEGDSLNSTSLFFVDRNYLSLFYGMVFVFSIMIYVKILDAKFFFFNHSQILFIAMGILLILIALSSRTVIFAVIFILFWLMLKKKNLGRLEKLRMNSRKRWFILSSSLLFFVGYANGYFNLIYYRIFEEGTLETGSGRTNIIELFTYNFFKRGFGSQLFGSGYGSQYMLTEGQDTHNDFLAILASYGYIGLLLWVIVLIRMFFNNNNVSSRFVFFFYLITATTVSPLMVCITPVFLALGFSVKSAVD